MADYHLMAELIVPQQSAIEFERKVTDFLNRGGFKSIDPRFDCELTVGLKSESAFSYQCYSAPQGTASSYSSSDAAAPRSVYRYINVWRLLGLEELDLARVMTLSSDNDLYTQINSLVTREFQNFVLRVQWLKGEQVRPEVKRFVRVTRQFTTKNLGKYLFKVGTTFPFLESHGWYSLGHYQAITGALNTVTELWQTRDGTHTPDSLRQVLEGLPEGLKTKVFDDLFNLHYAEMRESFVRAPYAGGTVEASPGAARHTGV